MRILLINVCAISGSTGKIVTDLKSVLESRGHQCIICFGANDNVKKHGYKRICPEIERKANAAISRLTGIQHGAFTPFSFYRLKRVIKDWNPDIVHVHCPNGYIIDIFKMLEFLAVNDIKTIVSNHAEYFYTGGCGHAFDCEKFKSHCFNCNILRSKLGLDVAKYEWGQFKRTFDLFKCENIRITSVSPWVKERALQAPAMMRFNHLVVMNGVDTGIFKRLNISQNVRNRLPMDCTIVLHVTAEFNNDEKSLKGGHWLTKLARKMPNVWFVVAAWYNKYSADLPQNILLWGRTKNQVELAELYNVADVTLLTSQRETFSMVTAESLCCGTPVVGFQAGGPESIAIPAYSQFVEYGNLDQLKEAVLTQCSKQVDRSEISEQAIATYSRGKMTDEYMDIYKTLAALP